MDTGFSHLHRRLLKGALLIALLSCALGSVFVLHRRYQQNVDTHGAEALALGAPESYAQKQLGKDLGLALALSGCFALGSILGMTLLLQRSLLRHLQDLRRHFALPGKEALAPFALKRRPPPMPDELDELVAAMNAHGQDTRALLDKERHQRARLMQRQAHLDRLLHALSHDLRQPLFTMEGGLAELYGKWQGKGLDADDSALLGLLREANQTIASRVAALERLLRIRNRDVHPADLDEEALETLLSRAIPAGHEESFAIGPLCPLHVDKEALREICVELFLNSLRAASPERPLQVRVYAQKQENSCSLHIEDNGRGMPLADLDKLELLFYKSEPPGVGLGISTCRALAYSLGGNLHFAAPPSGGLLVTLELPNPGAS